MLDKTVCSYTSSNKRVLITDASEIEALDFNIDYEINQYSHKIRDIYLNNKCLLLSLGFSSILHLVMFFLMNSEIHKEYDLENPDNTKYYELSHHTTTKDEETRHPNKDLTKKTTEQLNTAFDKKTEENLDKSFNKLSKKAEREEKVKTQSQLFEEKFKTHFALDKKRLILKYQPYFEKKKISSQLFNEFAFEFSTLIEISIQKTTRDLGFNSLNDVQIISTVKKNEVKLREFLNQAIHDLENSDNKQKEISNIIKNRIKYSENQASLNGMFNFETPTGNCVTRSLIATILAFETGLSNPGVALMKFHITAINVDGDVVNILDTYFNQVSTKEAGDIITGGAIIATFLAAEPSNGNIIPDGTSTGQLPIYRGLSPSGRMSNLISPSSGENNPSDPSGENNPLDPSGENNPLDPSGENNPSDPSGENNPSDPSGENNPLDPSGENNPSDPNLLFTQKIKGYQNLPYSIRAKINKIADMNRSSRTNYNGAVRDIFHKAISPESFIDETEFTAQEFMNSTILQFYSNFLQTINDHSYVRVVPNKEETKLLENARNIVIHPSEPQVLKAGSTYNLQKYNEKYSKNSGKLFADGGMYFEEFTIINLILDDTVETAILGLPTDKIIFITDLPQVTKVPKNFVELLQPIDFDRNSTGYTVNKNHPRALDLRNSISDNVKEIEGNSITLKPQDMVVISNETHKANVRYITTKFPSARIIKLK